MENEENQIVEFLRDFPLIDKILSGFTLRTNSNEIIAELFISGKIDSPKLTLRLDGVTSFDVYVDTNIYYISDYKLFFDNDKGEYYLSLDPDNSTIDINPNDRGVIIFRELIFNPS